MTYSISHDKPKGCMLLIFITDPHVSQVFIYLYIYIYIYDRIPNLNSHTSIFWESHGSNPLPHR
jgi:hypothetical protein